MSPPIQEIELTSDMGKQPVNSSAAENLLPVSSHQSDSNPPPFADDCGKISLSRLAAISVTAAGIQFGWALQLSLLTPYVETLGIPHAWASFIWLCGPISGLVVQPCVGVWSDNCTSKWGRRRPFIFVGSIFVALAILLISFSADLGYILGDKYHQEGRTKPFACAIFVIGFWCLDLSNNTVQGPSRALLSDMTGAGQRDRANALYSLWLAVGNILGYSTGSIGSWYKWFPWLTGEACLAACANLKAAFLLAIIFLFICTSITLYAAKETPLSTPLSAESDTTALLENGKLTLVNGEKSVPDGPASHGNVEKGSEYGGFFSVLVDLMVGMQQMSSGMKKVLVVMALTWLAWFPFLLFDTDWMGREVFYGDPMANGAISEAYQSGVRVGSTGLLLNSVVQAFTSLAIDPMCSAIGTHNVWALGNVILAACLASTYWITHLAAATTRQLGIGRPGWVSWLAIAMFATLGAPLAITFSVPYGLTADLTASSGGGQGLAMGILNLATVIPQMMISLGAGPWDQLFGGGNVPAFLMASVFALAGACVSAIFLRPSCKSQGCSRQGIVSTVY